jgi:hypothetical protein
LTVRDLCLGKHLDEAHHAAPSGLLNGFRDDAQCFRELYNAQSVEALKGPSAITFGRNAVTRTVERLRRLSRPLSRGGRCRQ